MVREPILLRSVLHDREIEVALTMARIEPLSTQPGPIASLRTAENTASLFSVGPPLSRDPPIGGAIRVSGMKPAIFSLRSTAGLQRDSIRSI